MEERRVLVGQEFCDVLVAVLCLTRVGDVCLWRVCEVDLLSCLWVYQWWQGTLSSMRDAEIQVLYMVSDAIQSS